MPALVRQSSPVFQNDVDSSTVTGAAIATVAAGATLVSFVVASRPNGAAGNIISGYGTTVNGSAGNSWGSSPIGRAVSVSPDGTWYTEITAWIAHNVTAGNTVGKPDFAFEDGSTTVWTMLTEWTGLALSSAVDKFAIATAAETATTITVGPTSALAQADQVIVALVANRYNYVWNGGYGSGTPPSTYELIAGRTDNSGGLVAQAVYKEVSTTAAVSATWTFEPEGNRTAALIFTLRKATTSLRMEVDNIDPEIANTTNWTFGAWPGNPFQTGPAGQCAKVWTGYAAVIENGKLIFPDAPPGATLGATYNVQGHQPNSTRTTAWMAGTVRESGNVVAPPPTTTPTVTVTMTGASNITQTGARVTINVSGTLPSDAITQIQVAVNRFTGPWLPSTIVASTVGSTYHDYTGLASGTEYTMRAFVYSSVSGTIYGQTGETTFTTTASGGGGGGGSEPPATLSAQRVVQLMTTSGSPGTTPNLSARGYGAHQFGATIAVGASLKHNRINASWVISGGVNTYCPIRFGWRDKLARINIDWLTVAHQFPPSGSHNQGVEWVAKGTFGRIRPSLNNGAKQWVQISYPTNQYAVGLINSGATVPGTVVARDGTYRVCRLHEVYTLHPWAKVSPFSSETDNEVDSNIFALAAINPADEYSDSKFDCIVSSWWIRVVPFDPGQPLGDITANPILAVCSGDPYVNRAMESGGKIGVDCASGIASSPFITLTTEWQQISYMTALDAPDKHTTFQDVGITTAEFLTALPPGYA